MKLFHLNLLYLLFCLPVVTIGPATAGFTYVLRNMANEQPIFLFSDFWDAFRQHWKQSLSYSVMWAVLAGVIAISLRFYIAGTETYPWMFAAVMLTLFVGFMLLLSSFYVMLMIVTLDLPLKAILKNALILAIVCLRTNLLTFLFSGMVFAFALLYFPYSFPLVLVILPAMGGFIICFNSYPGIKKYAIDPFVEAQAPADEPPDETLFRDEAPTSGE